MMYWFVLPWTENQASFFSDLTIHKIPPASVLVGVFTFVWFIFRIKNDSVPTIC